MANPEQEYEKLRGSVAYGDVIKLGFAIGRTTYVDTIESQPLRGDRGVIYRLANLAISEEFGIAKAINQAGDTGIIKIIPSQEVAEADYRFVQIMSERYNRPDDANQLRLLFAGAAIIDSMVWGYGGGMWLTIDRDDKSAIRDYEKLRFKERPISVVEADLTMVRPQIDTQASRISTTENKPFELS